MSKYEAQKRGMRHMRLLPAAVITLALLLATTARAAVTGIAGNSFSLTASADYISTPDGAMIYSWGYGCTNGGSPVPFGGTCPLMQIPGPTLILHEGASYTVTLTNSLPVAAGNTSIVFPGMQVTSSGGVPGILAQEAVPGGTVIYTITPPRPGTYTYYSGSQPELQDEMGLYGAIVVYPNSVPSTCTSGKSAFDSAVSCYDREYLFLLSELSLTIHQQAEVQAGGVGPIQVTSEPYQPVYFLVNGRGSPDDMDIPYTAYQPHQPYNANPHMHPGEQVLVRVVGAGRTQHPFHTHGNHVRVLARDGQMLLSRTDPTKLAGPLLFTIPSVPGQTVDGLWTWTGQDIGWDVYGHVQGDGTTCTPDASGFDVNTKEWCANHDMPIPSKLPDPNIVANGLWYSGSPYLGLQGALPPGTDGVNPYAGFAYMWHSHDERELTNNDVFPGGMLVMAIVEAPNVPIDETK